MSSNRRSKFGQNTLFNNPDEAHGADEEFLNCSRGINLPGSELACEGIARSPCAVKFTAPHNQMHMLKFLNETIAQLLKYYPGTEQKEEEQIEEVLSSDITRLHIKGMPTPGKPESKEKHNDHALPKTVKFVTTEVFWTTMGKDRARTRGRSTDGDTLNKWMVSGKQTLGQNIKVELDKKQEMIPVDLIPWLDANQYIWARGGVAFPGQTKALVRHPGVKVDFQRFVKPIKPEEQAKINQEMQELVESFHNLEPGEPEFDLQEEIERRAKKYGCYQVAMTYPKKDEISDEKEVGTEGK
ncbi:hypothetical protein CKAH01_18839 [Colletotrichum kahawae]|uniref:Uncharacterized protein n=1 Tax=Colletotrichum kahawae TaxID=34407 RepID=A0AAD9Y5Q2_COLKA|nr:hypothetical protein CKAH01_18839 [Colletotrichum kahawae]